MRSRGRSGGGFREAEARLPAAPLAWLLVSALAVASCSDSPSPPGSEPAPPPAPAESAPAESSAPAPPPQTWRFEGGGEVWAPPSLAGGRVFFVDDEGGRLVALEETSGEEAWSFAAGGRLRGAPAVSAEIVAVTAESGDALALDPAGKLLWRRAANAATGAALGGGAVFAVDRGGELVCLEAADGKERWRVEIGPPAGTPEIAGGRVFAATADGFLAAVDVERGAVLWRRSVGAGAASRVAGGSVYAVGGGFLWALRSADGAERWRLSGSEFLASPPVVTRSRVLAVAGDGELWIVESESGLERRRGDLGAPLRAPPTLLGSTAFIASGERSFVAIDLWSGRAVWHFETDTPMTGALAVSEAGRLIFGVRGGGLYAVSFQVPRSAPLEAVAGRSEAPEAIAVETAPSFHDAAPKLVRRSRLGAPALGAVVSEDLVLAVTREGLEAWDHGCRRRRPDDAASGPPRRIFTAPGSAASSLAAGSFAVADGQDVVRLDRRGRELWRRSLSALAGAPQPSGDGNVLVVADDAGRVWALSVQDGARLWRRQASPPSRQPSAARAALVVAEETVAVALCGAGLVTFDLRSGRERWRFPDLDCPPAPPRLAGELVYAVEASGAAVAIDRAVGGERWRVGLGPGARLTPGLYFGMLHVAGEDGSLRALDLLGGEIAWRTDLESRPASPPELLDGIAYLGDHDGMLHAVNALNGDPLWRASLGAPVRVAVPQPCDGRVLLHAAGDGGELITLELSS